MTKNVICSCIGWLIWTLAWPSEAQILSSFRVQQVESGCWIDDQDPFPSGDPERYFRFGIFDNASGSVLAPCAAGCVADTVPSTSDGSTFDYCTWDEGCGVWNVPDQTLQKITPDLSGVYFYFGLFDEDSDADDSLGDHWFWSATFRSGTELNNNVSPYYAGNPITFLCGGRDVEGTGDPQNFAVTFTAWFDDLSGPVPPGNPTHVDDTAPDSSWNDDGTLQFQWSPASDPNSAIATRTFDLWDDTAGLYVFDNVPAPEDSMTICASGCDASYTPVEEHVYWFRVNATNGGVVQLQNQQTASSGWAVVHQRTGTVDAPQRSGDAISFGLSRPAPNPFSDRVVFRYSLTREGRASLRVYDVGGRRIAELANEVDRPGVHLVDWDGRNVAGTPVPPGPYFVRLEAENQIRTRKVLKLR